jgi:hypothetical protein
VNTLLNLLDETSNYLLVLLVETSIRDDIVTGMSLTIVGVWIGNLIY